MKMLSFSIQSSKLILILDLSFTWITIFNAIVINAYVINYDFILMRLVNNK